MNTDKIMELLRIFVNNRVASNEQKSKIIVSNDDYDKAAKIVEKYDIFKLDEAKRKEVEDKNNKKPKTKSNNNDIRIYEYTEKSFIVIGDTISIKDVLFNMGGVYNKALNNPEKQGKVSGWVFSNRHIEKVQDELKVKKINKKNDR